MKLTSICRLRNCAIECGCSVSFFSFCNLILVFLYTMFLENDRKSNVDVLESNKNANKEDIKRLREENKELRQKYAQLQRVLLLFACKEKWFSNYLQCIDYCTR